MSATYTLIIQFVGPIGMKEKDLKKVELALEDAGGDVREFILESDED